MTESLPDVWTTRDYPVLREVVADGVGGVSRDVLAGVLTAVITAAVRGALG